MKIARNEYNTTTATAEIWAYTLTDNGKGIISSERIMSCPVAPWADAETINHELVVLAVVSGRWYLDR